MGYLAGLAFGFSLHAIPLEVPASAIPDDTFFVATADLIKMDAATLDATVKAALGDKAGTLDEFLSHLKPQITNCVDNGAQRVTVVMHGDPDKQNEPQPVFYVKFKADADHAVAEKLIRHDLPEAEADKLEITNDGDFMVIRKKMIVLPETGSPERTKLFADVLGESDKPLVGALIYNAAIIANVQKDLQHGMPPAMGTVINDSKAVIMDVALGEGAKARLTLQCADEEAAKRVSEAVTTLDGLMKAAIAASGVVAPVGAGPQAADEAVMIEVGSIIADALKPEQAADKVTINFDSKAVGALLRGWVTVQRLEEQNAPANKAGL